jgi:hypothetical protein
MFLSLLAFWHNLTLYLTGVWNAGKQMLRDALGPSPQHYYLLPDCRVLPTTMTLPSVLTSTVFLYNPHTHRIYQNATPQDARYSRLPYIAASFNHVSTGEVDISDWLGEIRAHPVPELPVKQLLTLWSYTHNRYVPLSDGVQVSVTKNDGETDLVTFD